MNLECSGHRVIIQPDDESAKGTILIPERFKKTANRGTVVVVGDGRRHIDGKVYPLKAKSGDRVVFSLIQMLPFEHEGVKYAVMDEDAILVYLKPDAAAN